MKSYADLLKGYIEKSGKTLEKIAEECERKGVKVHPTYISKLRLGKRPAPSSEVSKALAEVTGGNSARLLWLGWVDDNPPGVKETLINVNDDVVEKAMALYEKYPDSFLVENEIDVLEGLPEYEEFMDSLGKALSRNSSNYYSTSSDKTINIIKENTTSLYENDELPPNSLIDFDLLTVPTLGKIPAGEPIHSESNIIDWTILPNINSFNKDEIFVLIVQGDSMVGSRIYDGDRVVVKRQVEVENGEIAVVNVNGDDATLKRVKKINGQTILYPDNPKYEPIFIENENARIIGKVIQVLFEPGRG